MKKFINSLICVGLLTGSMASALMNPVRVAKCIVDSQKYQCTEEENKQTKAWIATASIGALIAVLALIGLTVGPEQARKLREKYATKQEITNQMSGVARELQLLKEKPRKTEADRARIDVLEQEISRLSALRETV